MKIKDTLTAERAIEMIDRTHYLNKQLLIAYERSLRVGGEKLNETLANIKKSIPLIIESKCFAIAADKPS